MAIALHEERAAHPVGMFLDDKTHNRSPFTKFNLRTFALSHKIVNKSGRIDYFATGHIGPDGTGCGLLQHR